MNKVKVDKDVPLPVRGTEKEPGSIKYPFNEMEVGDSFSVESVSSIRSLCVRFNKTGRKFRVLKCKDGSHRCWRTE